MKRIKGPVLLLVLILVITSMLAPSALAAGTEDISVQLGDEMIQFTDAEPILENGRTFVPVRAVLEALGAEVSYDQAAGSVTAVRGDTTIEFHIGQTAIDITRDGETTVLETDAASFIRNDRLMAPVRFISEAFGCTVGWDSDEKTVLILDTESILDRTENYTLVNKLLAFSNKYSQSAFAVTGTFDVSVNVTSDGKTYPVISDGTITGLADSSAVNLDVEIETDLSGLYAALEDTEDLSVYNQAMLSMFEDMKFEYIMDIAEYKMYMRSPLLSTLMGMSGDAWLAVDFGELFEASGLDESAFTNMYTGETATAKDMLGSFLSYLELTDVGELSDITEALDTVDAICSDSAFVKSGSTYTNSQTYDYDDTAMAYKLALIMQDDEVVGYSMTFDVSADEMEMSMNYVFKNDQMAMDMSVTAPEELEVQMNMTMQYKATTDTPLNAPEEGSTIIDAMNLQTGGMI